MYMCNETAVISGVNAAQRQHILVNRLTGYTVGIYDEVLREFGQRDVAEYHSLRH